MTLALDLDHRADDVRTPGSRRRSDIDGMVRAHLPLVSHLVREVANRVPAHVDRDELTSAAMLALVTSAQNFDETVGAPFGHFASIRIRGALTDQLRSMDWASRSVRGRARALDVTRSELSQTLGRTPSSAEVATASGMSRQELAKLEADAHRSVIMSMHALPGDDGPEALPEPGETPESLLLRREQVGCLHDAIAELPPRLRLVVEQYFLGQRRMIDIAADLGVTESRVSQLRSEALALLRESMRADGDADEGAADGTSTNRSTVAQRLARTTILCESVPTDHAG